MYDIDFDVIGGVIHGGVAVTFSRLGHTRVYFLLCAWACLVIIKNVVFLIRLFVDKSHLPALPIRPINAIGLEGINSYDNCVDCGGGYDGCGSRQALVLKTS